MMNKPKLNLALKANAIFSAACAFDLLLFSDWIADYIGLSNPLYLKLMGPGLLVFSLFVYWVSRTTENESWVKSIIIMDRSWVIGSLLLMMFGYSWFNTSGLILLGFIGLVVGLFAETQNYFLKQTEASQ